MATIKIPISKVRVSDLGVRVSFVTRQGVEGE